MSDSSCPHVIKKKPDNLKQGIGKQMIVVYNKLRLRCSLVSEKVGKNDIVFALCDCDNHKVCQRFIDLKTNPAQHMVNDRGWAAAIIEAYEIDN